MKISDRLSGVKPDSPLAFIAESVRIIASLAEFRSLSLGNALPHDY
jgi:hypothetical protein